MKYSNTKEAISGRKKVGRMKSVWIWIAMALIAVAAAGCVSKPDDMTKNETLATPETPTVPSTPTKPDLTLNNYMKLFENDVIIVIRENATQIERDGANAIVYNLGEVTGNTPIIKTDAGVMEKEKSEYNLILVGRPDANRMLRDVYERTNATKITDEYPGADKGILEILRNPWNESKTMLLVEGSDEWGVRAGSIALEDRQQLKDKNTIVVDWEEVTGIKFPIDNAEEAIRYSNTDIRVKEFIKKESAKGYRVDTSAIFSNTNNNWIVGYHVQPVERVLHMYVNPNGTIIFGGVAT